MKASSVDTLSYLISWLNSILFCSSIIMGTLWAH